MRRNALREGGHRERPGQLHETSDAVIQSRERRQQMKEKFGIGDEPKDPSKRLSLEELRAQKKQRQAERTKIMDKANATIRQAESGGATEQSEPKTSSRSERLANIQKRAREREERLAKLLKEVRGA